MSGYHPAEDMSAELNAEGLNYFQELIGVLRWGIELGRVDILLEVPLLFFHFPSQDRVTAISNVLPDADYSLILILHVFLRIDFRSLFG